MTAAIARVGVRPGRSILHTAHHSDVIAEVLPPKMSLESDGIDDRARTIIVISGSGELHDGIGVATVIEGDVIGIDEGDAFTLTATGHVPLRIVIVAAPAESGPLGLVSD